jgi:MYXO-CTERM domain-containing protein
MPNAHSVGKFPFVPGWRSALLLFLAVVSFAGVAAAAGRVVWKRTKIEELDKSWKLAFEVHLDRAPDVAHVPVRFSFTPTAYFERSLVDGHKEPVTRTQPLEHQQPIVESVDVSFLDPASGKTAPRTRFMFQVTRDRGFEAGQYEVKITDARSGKELGGGTSLTLTGDNAVVDRRSVVFDDKPKEKPKAEAPAAEQKELSPEDDAFWAGGPRKPEEKTPALPPPASLQDKPGCGCRLGNEHSNTASLALGALGLALLTRRARRSAHS